MPQVMPKAAASALRRPAQFSRAASVSPILTATASPPPMLVTIAAVTCAISFWRSAAERPARIRVADKAFDADWLRADLTERGAQAVIPPRKHRKSQIFHDAEMDKWRHSIENYFAKIKEFRDIATRHDETEASFKAKLNLTATLIACGSMSTGSSA